MSRGGGRGGRGGRRGGMANAPWAENLDPNIKSDGRPVDLFPAYNVPVAAPLSKQESRVVEYYLLVREQVRAGPLYTHTLTASTRAAEATRAYGQDQINQRYGVKNKATVDPFVAVPLYSNRFEKAERTLPDLSARPFSTELFPPELKPTLEGDDTGRRGGAAARPNKRRRLLALADNATLRTAEEIFNQPSSKDVEAGGDEEGGDNTQKAIDQLRRFEELAEGEDNAELDLIEDEGDYGDDVDEQYSDEDQEGGDYDAENYFEDGENDDDGFGDGDDGGEDAF